MSQLISEWTIGPVLPRWCGWLPLDTGTRGLVGLPTSAETLTIWRLDTGSATKQVEFRIPSDTEFAAAHAASERVAVVSRLGELLILNPAGEVLKSRALVGAGEFPHAALLNSPSEFRHAAWSPTGRVLWLGSEDEYGENGVHALSGDSLETLGACSVSGDLSSGHLVRTHPDDSSALIEVSCGQDGSWVTAVHVDKGGVERLPCQIDSPGNPFCLSEFDDRGEIVVGVSGTAVRAYSWPHLRELASARPADLSSLEFECCLQNSKVIVAGNAKPEWECLHLSIPDLQVERRVGLGFTTEQVHEVYPLRDSHFLTRKLVLVGSPFGQESRNLCQYGFWRI